MTKLEWKRFWKFWKKHPFAYITYELPPEAGYYIIVKSLFSKDEENITDMEYMIDHF